MNYKQKYIKYKLKYIKLQQHLNQNSIISESNNTYSVKTPAEFSDRF
jgi:hypothetical protein